MTDSNNIKPLDKQLLFARLTYLTLIDLTVLSLFAEFWDKVYVASFSVALLVAIVLQPLLQLTFWLEHKATHKYTTQTGTAAKVKRIGVTWFIVFSSKFVILWIIQFFFAEDVAIIGHYHIATFILIVTVIVAAEQLMLGIHKALGKK